MFLGAFVTSLAWQAGLIQPSVEAPSAIEPFSSQILSALLVVALEIAVVALVCGTLYVLTRLIVLRAMANRTGLAEWRQAAMVKARNLLLAVFFLLAAGLLTYNAWLVVRGVSVRERTLAVIGSMTAARGVAIGLALAKLALATVALVATTRLLRRLLRALERTIGRWAHLRDNNRSLEPLFKSLDHAVVNLGWMLLAVLAFGLFAVPPRFTDGLLLIVRIYLVIAVGVIIIRSASVIVDTLDAAGSAITTPCDRWCRRFAPVWNMPCGSALGRW
jgi:moderate conductance mechanosensitive channel